MFERIKARLGRATQGLSLVSPYLKALLWTIRREFFALATEGYSRNAVVYACLRLLTQGVAEPPLLAYEVDEQFQRKQAAYNHPLQQLIRAPNELMTEFKFMELTELQLGIAGKSFWWKRRNNLGEVVGLYPLRPDRVGPKYGQGEVLEGWVYIEPGSGEPVVLPRSEVIPFILPDPTGETGGMVEGLGPLQVLAREVETDNEATAYVAFTLKNSAQPSGILKLKQAVASKVKMKEIKDRWRQEFGGARRGETAILDADADYQTVAFNMQQLEFPNLRHVSEARIAAAFGVPAILVGLKVGLDAGIRATIQDQRRYFTEMTLATRWRMISDTLTNHLAPDFGENLILRFDLKQVRALIEQSRFEVEPLVTAYQFGAVTIDEYRAKVLGLGALPNGQGAFVMVPVNAIPVPMQGDVDPDGDLLTRDAGEYDPDHAAQTGGYETDGARAAKGEFGQPHPHHGGPGRHAGAFGRPHPHPGNRGPKRDPLWYNRPGTGGVPPSPDDPNPPDDPKRRKRARARVAHRDRVQRHAARGLDRLALALNMQGMALAQRAEAQAAPAGKSWSLGEIATAEERQRLVGIVTDIRLGALHDAYRQAADDLGQALSPDLKGPALKSYLADSGERADLILATAGRAARAALDEHAGHRYDLAATLADLDCFKASRASGIAANEAALASNLATLLAYQEAGVASVEVVDEGDHDCAPCRAADGAIWTVEEALRHPLEHPGCLRTFAPADDDTTVAMAAD